MPSREKLGEFAAGCANHIAGDETFRSGTTAQILRDRRFQALGQGGLPESRIRKAKAEGGGTSFADLVGKPVVLIEMKKRGEKLQKSYRQAFERWTRRRPGSPYASAGERP